jgi:predicted RNA methylase
MGNFDPGDGRFINVDGNMVQADALHIAEKLKDYDENIEIICVDPHQSDFNEAPFVICERRADGTLNRIFEAWALDDSVVERVMLADQRKFDPMARYDTMAAMQRKLKDDRYREKMGPAKELVEAVVRNNKNTFTYRNEEGDLVKIHDDRPAEKVNVISRPRAKSPA